MSVHRTVRVLEELATGGPAGLRGLARRLEIPVGSAHRLLTALEDERVVERTVDDEWTLSPRLLTIAGAHLKRLELPAVARPILERLAASTGQTAFLGVQSGTDVVYLDKVQTDAQVQLYVELGARRPVYSTALGKAMLAFGPKAACEEFLAAADLVAITPRTVTDADVLRTELELTHDRGYATDKHEAVLGVSCLAVPIRNIGGRVVGAVSVAGTDPRLEAEAPNLVDAVVEAGAAISGRLGSGGA